MKEAVGGGDSGGLHDRWPGKNGGIEEDREKEVAEKKHQAKAL